LNDLLVILPTIILALGGTILLLVDLAIPRESKAVTGWVAIAILALSGLVVPMQWGVNALGFGGMVKADAYSLFLDVLFAVIGVITILISQRYNAATGIMRGEFYPLMLFSLSGMSLLGHANDLLIVFLGIELLSIPLYVLCGFARPKQESEESAMKYFLLGAFASGFLVYGVALMYGATGSTNLSVISKAAALNTHSGLLLAGAALVLVGLGFKAAMAPFHMWTPDVYQGAPTVVTAFMSTATKAAAFAAMIRVLMLGLLPIAAAIQPAIVVLAALTMIVGNVTALAQKDLKRMLAYSSIAHAGYILLGVASGATAAPSVLFYLASYAATSLAAFGVMTSVGADQPQEDQSIAAYTGLFNRRPMLAVVMALAMFSFMGIPPTAGFAGKYFLFQSAVNSGLVWLAVLGVITSVVSVAYYLRVVITMFSKQTDEAVAGQSNAPRSVWSGVATLAAAIAILWIGLMPASLLAMASLAP